MPIKSLLISLVIPTIVISNSSSSYIYSEAKTEVSGENATAETKIETTVNGQTTKVESNQPGEVKLEVKNGVAKIETNPSVTPTVVMTDLPEKTNKNQIISFLENFFSRFLRFFHFRT